MNTAYDFRPQSFARWIRLADEHLRAANMRRKIHHDSR
jgi:hypothetical protein